MGSRPSSLRATIKLTRLIPPDLSGMAHHHPLQVHLGHLAALTHRANPGHEDMLSDFNRDHGDFDDFPSPVHPSPGQVGSTIWADLHGMQRALSWLHPPRLYRGHGAAVCVAHSVLALGLWAAYSPACQVSPVGSNHPLRPRYAFAIAQWLPVARQSLPAGFPGSRWKGPIRRPCFWFAITNHTHDTFLRAALDHFPSSSLNTYQP